MAEKIGVETAAEFCLCAGDARPEELKAELASAPDVPPERGDEIPEPSQGRLGREVNVVHTPPASHEACPPRLQRREQNAHSHYDLGSGSTSNRSAAAFSVGSSFSITSHTRC